MKLKSKIYVTRGRSFLNSYRSSVTDIQLSMKGYIFTQGIYDTFVTQYNRRKTLRHSYVGC